MKNTTITIGIPTFNEEQNIKAFLYSIVQQKLDTVVIENIFVYSDRSTDRTNEIVKKLKKDFPIIKLIEGKTRKGKYFRVNEFFKMNKSDVLLILDADIALGGSTFVETISQELLNDPQAVMIAANTILIRPKGFVPKILHTHFVLWDFVRMNVPNFDSAENFLGTATAYRKSFAHSLRIPSTTTDPHFYIYLSARKINGFRYSIRTKVFQYAPSTMNDVKNLLNRSIGKRDKDLEKIFGKKMIERAHFIPMSAKIVGILKCFLWQPFYTPLAIIFNLYLNRMNKPKNVDSSPIWKINASTKKPITTYAK